MSTVLVMVTGLSLGVAAFASVIAWRLVRDERRRSEARVEALAAEIGAEPGDSPLEPASVLPFPLAAAAIVAFVAAGAVGAAGAFALNRDAATSAAPIATPAAPVADVPLELVALGHDRAGTGLTVRGIVRNPAGSASRSGLSAFVQIYDDRGGLLTTGSAPVASAALEPGAESTFVIVVPNADRVERYRVSFRSADNVIPHMDRRAGV